MCIFMSEHARIRCKQQGIDENSVIRQLSNVPNFEGKMRWVVKEGAVIMKRLKRNKVVITTVIGNGKLDDKRKQRSSKKRYIGCL